MFDDRTIVRRNVSCKQRVHNRVRENDTCASKKGGARNDGAVRGGSIARYTSICLGEITWTTSTSGRTGNHSGIVSVLGVDGPERIEGKINSVPSTWELRIRALAKIYRL